MIRVRTPSGRRLPPFGCGSAGPCRLLAVVHAPHRLDPRPQGSPRQEHVDPLPSAPAARVAHDATVTRSERWRSPSPARRATERLERRSQPTPRVPACAPAADRPPRPGVPPAVQARRGHGPGAAAGARRARRSSMVPRRERAVAAQPGRRPRASARPVDCDPPAGEPQPRPRAAKLLPSSAEAQRAATVEGALQRRLRPRQLVEAIGSIPHRQLRAPRG